MGGINSRQEPFCQKSLPRYPLLWMGTFGAIATAESKLCLRQYRRRETFPTCVRSGKQGKVRSMFDGERGWDGPGIDSAGGSHDFYGSSIVCSPDRRRDRGKESVTRGHLDCR